MIDPDAVGRHFKLPDNHPAWRAGQHLQALLQKRRELENAGIPHRDALQIVLDQLAEDRGAGR